MLSNAFVALALDNWFKNTDITNMGDAAGVQNSAADGSLYYALHSAWPGATGDQSTSEITYTGYERTWELSGTLSTLGTVKPGDHIALS